jgi:HEAT repeat protein
VRAAAATALGSLLDTRAVVTLVELTQDEAFAVRQAATRALDAFGMSALVVGLAATMADGNGPPDPDSAGWVRRALVTRARPDQE